VAKRKGGKGQTIIYKTLYMQTTKDWATRAPLKTGNMWKPNTLQSS
jgi:hypothetical protein